MKKRKAAVLAAAAFAITAACFLNSTQRAEAADNVVVMLDPGHDSTHTGAAAYGLKEQQLNLKIGLACRTELEKYDGITVYMTHDTIACPFEGSTTKQDLIQRAEYAGEVGADVRMAKRAGLLHDIGKSIDHEMEGSHIQIGVDLCKKYKESQIVINAVEAHHGDVEPESLIACIVQAADAISAARPGARRETLETYTNRLKQLEDITNEFKGVEKSFAIQAGREIRVMVVPDHVSDADMVLLARDIAKQIEAELEYPGQIKVNVIRESRAVDYAK